MGTHAGHTTYYTYLDAPIGKLMLAGCRDHGLRLIAFPCGRRVVAPEPHWRQSAAPFREVSRQLAEYFRGRRTAFDVKLNAVGTPFQLEVWSALLAIPYGETRSYGQIAKAIGRPRAVRAVGLANGRNPLPIVVPCHRVIGSTGRLVGYGGGLRVKEELLALESSARAGGRVGRRPSRSSGREVD
jgi:methylated-DNA-[protein]-cysteine S-methyltransferase